MLTPFEPPWWARSPITQTLLTLLPMRVWGRNELVANEREEVLRLSQGVNLHGVFSAARSTDVRGLAILFTGWEGHARAAYMLRTGDALYRAGYDVYRITYPDHGDTQDLNEAVFQFGMLDKMAEAVARILGAVRTRPVALVGFSMGGNLALNLVARGLPGVKVVVAVSPAFDFGLAISTLEASIFHGKFLGSWKASLARKQALFPHRYNFDETVEGAESVTEIAGDLMVLEGRTPAFEDYVSRYALTPEKLRRSSVPMHVLASTDDPIVGKVDYAQFAGIERLTLHLQTHGGHVGFVPSLLGPAWYEAAIVELVSDALAPRPRVTSRLVPALKPKDLT